MIKTHILEDHYSWPTGLEFDSLQHPKTPFIDAIPTCHNNANKYASILGRLAYKMTKKYSTDNLLLMMGDDFTYSNAELIYGSLDRLIEYVNSRPKLDMKL